MISKLQYLFRNPRFQRIRRLWQMKPGRLGGLQYALPKTVCIDVGASYYPHTTWWLFLSSAHAQWLAVEPNRSNLEYLDKWPWEAEVRAIVAGLSRFGGTQTLYVTNVDSGSSLLKPVIHPIMKHRAGAAVHDYLFPVTELDIDTLTLDDVIGLDESCPTIVKLDTQGSELDILRSVIGAPKGSSVVGVELECSLLAQPYYEKSPRLWEVAAFMDENGFELLLLEIVPRIKTAQKISPAPRRLANESDAVFSLRQDVAATKQIEVRAALLGFYVTNCFYSEACSYLATDSGLEQYLQERGCDTTLLRNELLRRQ
jgi:FkbM family methyltransferase